MSTKKLHSVNFILDKIKEKENLTTDAQLAHFLEKSPSTIGAWRSRETLDWELILTKCNRYIYELLYDTSSLQGKTSEPDINFEDLSLSDYEQQVIQMVQRIEEGPFTPGSKIQLFDSLLRIVNKELAELRSQSDPAAGAKSQT
ncbi:MAG TPA: hypothetical protein VF181_03050 [Balneolaceae bacterium]